MPVGWRCGCRGHCLLKAVGKPATSLCWDLRVHAYGRGLMVFELVINLLHISIVYGIGCSGYFECVHYGMVMRTVYVVMPSLSAESSAPFGPAFRHVTQ